MSRVVRCGRLLAAAALLLAACASREERLADHVARAEARVAEGRFGEALLEYQSALELAPNDAELHQRLGDVLMRQRAFADAAAYYRQAFQLDPERIDAAMNEARLLAFGEPKRAQELVKLGMERAPERPDVQRTRAHVALTRGDVGEAQLAAQRAVELDPGSAASWSELGKVKQAVIRKHQLAGKRAAPEFFQAALDAFARADQIAGGDVPAQVERARVLAAWQGHRDEALAAYRATLAGAKQRGDAAGRLIAAKAFEDFAAREGDNRLRREALREVVEADEDDYDSWDRLARLSLQGEEVCRELIARRPEDPRAHRVYASWLLRRRRPADAIAHLRRTLDEGPAAPLLWEQLITIQLRTQQIAAARAALAEMADEYPDDPVTKGAQARLALAEGRAADAAATLRELVKTNESAESQRLLALAEQRLGNIEAAIAAIDRAVALAGPAAEYYRTKARIHHEAKQWGQVILAYRVLAGRGQRFTASDELRRIQALYGVDRPDAARDALAALLARPNPPAEAAIEFAKREGAAQPDAARAVLEAALARSPGDPRPLEALVGLDTAAGHPERALARIDAEIEAGRARPRVLFVRAQLLAAQGDLTRAEADVLRAFEAAPALPGAVELLFDIYRRQGRLAEAQRSFEQAESAGVLHAGARLLLARLYSSQGEFEKAQQALEKVVVESPDLASAKNDLAFLLARRGEQLERAIELAREAQRALPESPEALDTLGYVFYRAGRHEAALLEARRALALAETRLGAAVPPVYPYHLGLVLQALGRNDEAARAFERALGNAEGFPEAEDARRRLESVLATSGSGANAS